MRRRRHARPLHVLLLVVLALALAALTASLLSGDEEEDGSGGTLRRPIDPRQQTALGFGQRSHWLQPWRAYLDTVPAARLRDAIGINFNVAPSEAEATAALLSETGFARARVEIGWDAMSYSDPTRLGDPGRVRSLVGPLAGHGIRPLILLNAHQGAPGPVRRFSAELSEPAQAGARSVRLTPATALQAIPGRSGLDRDDGKAADILFTAVRADGTAELSKPLPAPLEAGPAPASTLRFEPFGPPLLADGQPNPRFEATLAGWLDYARAVVAEARTVVGSDEFDVEVWNELSFGSEFLSQENYYEPPREQGEGDVTREILERTVGELRGPSSPAPGVGIGDGFASQTPFPAGSTSPVGLTAIDKHPYYAIKRFPAEALLSETTPLDARGRPSFEEESLPDDDDNEEDEVIRRDRFIPSYEAFFPEYILSAIQTETLIRDLSPITSEINGVEHGRGTHPPGGRPPAVWITETNLDPTGADPSDPSNPGAGPIDHLDSEDVRHLHAKAALRYYTAFVAKGVEAVHLYAVKGGESLSLVDPAFFESFEGSGGETLSAVRRLTDALEGSVELERTEPLSLLAVSDDHGNSQFEGQGTVAHPRLYDREVTAFFPFQVAPGHYVAATYVMTRNLAKRYDEDSDEPTRFDLPEAPFRLRIGGLEGSRVEARATDPLTGSSVPVEIVARSRRSVTLELELTDSPRLVTLRVS